MNANTDRSNRAGGLSLLAVLAALSVLIAACGGGETSETAAGQQDVIPIGPADAQTGETGDEGTAATGVEQAAASPTFTQAEAQDAYRAYVRCLQDEGIPVGPPAFTIDGKIDIDADLAYWESLSEEDIAGLDDETTDFDAVDESCRPEHAEALYALIAPDESRVQELENQFMEEFGTQMTDLARCMRRTFPEFPDPVLPDLTQLSEDADIDPFPGIDDDDPIYTEPFDQCATEIGLEIGPSTGAGS